MLALPPLAAEPIFNIGFLPVTNSIINTWIALVLFVVFAFFLQRSMKKHYAAGKFPKGLVNFFESLLESMLSYMDGVTKNRRKSLKLLPIIGTFFLFILISNWMGLLPGIGSIAKCYNHHEKTYVAYEYCITPNETYHAFPLFRPANTDLNMTIAMAVLAVTASHVLGIIAIGFFKYANKFIKLGDIYHAIKSKNPVKILTACVEFFVGILETVSEFAKMLSLSLRLFGNIFAGEVLLTVIAGLIAYLAPLPFMALEILVGAVQAVVFSMLALVYLTMALEEPHGSHEEHPAH